MKRRPSSLFRGSELFSLLFLAAIGIAGWAYMYNLVTRPVVKDEPPPPSVPVTEITPVVADDGLEFQALTDKAPMQPRDSAAYALLLERVRDTSPEELSKKARRDVFFTNLWDDPKHYRGVPIHLVGTARKVLTHEVASAMSPKGRLYELWFYSDENHSFPYVIAIEDAPSWLKIGHELNIRMTVDGYFLKLLKYRAGDQDRGAPMLVGRIGTITAVIEPAPKMFDWSGLSRLHLLYIVLVVIISYIAIRVVFQVKKANAGTRVREPFSSSTDGLPPENVADWLQNLPQEAQENPDHHG